MREMKNGDVPNRLLSIAYQQDHFPLVSSSYLESTPHGEIYFEKRHVSLLCWIEHLPAIGFQIKDIAHSP